MVATFLNRRCSIFTSTNLQSKLRELMDSGMSMPIVSAPRTFRKLASKRVGRRTTTSSLATRLRPQQLNARYRKHWHRLTCRKRLPDKWHVSRFVQSSSSGLCSLSKQQRQRIVFACWHAVSDDGCRKVIHRQHLWRKSPQQSM